MPVRRISEEAKHYGGYWDTKSGPSNLKAEDVTVSQNMRISPTGGRYTRPGYEQQADLGTSAKVDDIYTHTPYGVMFCKSGTKIFQSVDGITWNDIGVTRTASERDFFFSYGKDVFVTNKTDAFLRIAVSTLASALASGGTSLVLRTGDGASFTANTVYCDGDQISSSGIATDTLTVSNVDADHAAAAIVTQTSTPSGAPKGSWAFILEDRALVGGVSANPNIVYYSAIATAANPEYIYDFSANGAGTKAMEGSTTAGYKGIGTGLIGMKKGISFAYTFNIDTGGLQTRDLTLEHGVPNAYCITQLGPRYYVFTGKRILPVAVADGAAQILDDPTQPFTAFDFRLRGELDQADDDQTFASLFANPVESELILTMAQDGVYYEFVYDADTARMVSKDTKNFSCSTMFNGRRYAGSDNDDKIYLDGERQTDDLLPIRHRIVSKEYSLKAISCSYRKFTFQGLLSGNGQFTFRVYLNGKNVDERLITAQDLVDAGLMDTASGIPIGSGNVGPITVGSSGSTPNAYMFTYPFTMKLKGESIQFEWEIFDEGTVFQLDNSDLIYETSSSVLLPSQ